MRRRTVVLIGVVAALAVGGIATAVRIMSDAEATMADDQRSAEEEPAALRWSGPVRDVRGQEGVQPIVRREDMTLSSDDPRDAIDWIDITRVRLAAGAQPHWYIELAAPPPPAAGLDRGELIAYGLVLETTGDGVADYVVGIDNEAPRQGDYHVWVTDLTTGETDEQIGPPYGFPVEFAHPWERQPGDPPGPPTVVFTFLSGSEPAGVSAGPVRFYAWASATEDGVVVAWDYAPDTTWLGVPSDPE